MNRKGLILYHQLLCLRCKRKRNTNCKKKCRRQCWRRWRRRVKWTSVTIKMTNDSITTATMGYKSDTVVAFSYGNEEEPCSSARDNSNNYRTLSKSAQRALDKLAPFTKEGNNTEREQAFVLQRTFDGTSSTTTTTRRKRRCVSNCRQWKPNTRIKYCQKCSARYFGDGETAKHHHISTMSHFWLYYFCKSLLDVALRIGL